MWACGIILYLLIEKGKHPFCDIENDNQETYLQKL